MCCCIATTRSTNLFVATIFCLLWSVKGDFVQTVGHYPKAYCSVSEVVLDTKLKTFFYKADSDLHSQCSGVQDIWTIRNDSGINLLNFCDEFYDVGHAFTIYYWHGGSNYFHLHYDMLIPLYAAVYNGKSSISNIFQVLMPTVESRRLQAMDWNTDAFSNSSKYWIQLVKAIIGPNEYMPLDQQLVNKGGRVCFNKLNFGTPAVSFKNRDLIRSFVEFIQESLGILKNTDVNQRIAVISRSNRRRILNEEELINSLQSIAPVDRLDFNGMSFYHQVRLMQNYTILVGMIGAGLTNGLYLPPGGVVVQLVPFGIQLNNVEFGILLQGGAGGGYIEWQNQIAEKTLNSYGDTIVTVDEVFDIVKQAFEMYQTSRLKVVNDEL